MKIRRTRIWRVYCWPMMRLIARHERHHSPREAWISRRRGELRDARYDEPDNADWIMLGAERQAEDEWRVAQHRSLLGLRQRLWTAQGWCIVAVCGLWFAWPVLLPLLWLASHVTVSVGWE